MAIQITLAEQILGFSEQVLEAVSNRNMKSSPVSEHGICGEIAP
jgi:hypothetical protein